MEQDTAMRAAARAIYDTVYPSDEWAPIDFEEAQRFRTPRYRQAVDAARQARLLFASSACHQLLLF